MNIVQLYERVRFWTDTAGSARFESQDIDNAVNTAMNDIINEKYKATRAISKGDSFQRTQRIRDELSNIVKVADTTGGASIRMTFTTGQILIPKAYFPEDYHYLLCIALYSTAVLKHNCYPLTYDQLNVIDSNPYRRPRIGLFPRQYYIESSLGITIRHAFTVNPVRVVLYYLSNAIQYNYGIERISSYNWSVDTPVIAITDTVYMGSSKVIGTKFNITGPNYNIASGSVVDTYTESDINEQLHEDIARKAAVNLLLTIKEFDKVKALTEYFV